MLLGTPHDPADAVTRFHHLWTYGAITAALSGVIGSMIPRPSAPALELTAELTPEPAAVDADLVLATDVA